MQATGVVIALVLVLVSLGACEQEVEDCAVTDFVAECESSWPEDEAVKKLKLRKIEKILSQDLAKYKDLESIDVSNSGLHHIDQDAFTANEKLIELNLAGNLLHIPQKGSFFVSKSLTHLNLSLTNFKNVSENIFSDLPNLQEIDLSLTGFKQFSLLSKLEQLKTLIISEDTAINQSLICRDSHLQQIIQVNELTYNCSRTKENITATVEAENEANPEISTEVNNATTEKSAPPENLEAPKTDSEIPVSVAKQNQTLPTPDNKKPQTENTEIQTNPETETENSAEAEKPVEDKKSAEKPEDSERPAEKPVDSESPSEKSEDAESPAQKPEDAEKPAEKSGDSEKPVEKPAETEEKPTEKSTKTEENDGALDSLIQLPDLARKEQRTTEKTHEEVNAEPQEKINIEEVKDQAKPNESSGVNIVLGIILCVMVVGALGFGFKYWKGRRQGYRNANTEDVEEGKELQNMVATNHKEEEQN